MTLKDTGPYPVYLLGHISLLDVSKLILTLQRTDIWCRLCGRSSNLNIDWFLTYNTNVNLCTCFYHFDVLECLQPLRYYRHLKASSVYNKYIRLHSWKKAQSLIVSRVLLGHRLLETLLYSATSGQKLCRTPLTASGQFGDSLFTGLDCYKSKITKENAKPLSNKCGKPSLKRLCREDKYSLVKLEMKHTNWYIFASMHKLLLLK